MKKYAVSKETFNYITAILADKPNQLLHDWEQWLKGANVGSDEYEAVRELNKVGITASFVITELLQGKAELELDERKYRLYHEQPNGHDGALFSYHFFDKNYDLNEDDFFTSIPLLTEEQVNEIADIEGQWVWEWAHEVK